MAIPSSSPRKYFGHSNIFRHSSTIQEVCAEYALRRDQFKKRRLRWRGKRSLGWIPFKKSGIQIKDGYFCYMGHKYKVFQPARLPLENYGAGELCEDTQGRWYLCISVEYEVAETNATSEVGIDLGLKDVATLSNGKKVANGRYFRMMERKLGRAQKFKKKKQARKIHAKIKNKRMDLLQKASTEIVINNRFIVVGKFGAKKLKKTKMAKSVSDAATSMFKNMLRHKASAHRHVYLEVSESYSTQICSVCHEVSDGSQKGLKDLGVREWVCGECGAVHDRDVNAALNILRFGHESLVPKGA